MDGRAQKKPLPQKWVIFVCGVLCIAAIGVSVHFFDLERRERDRRIEAENRVVDLTAELRLLEEKNRELAQRLRDARKIAEELAREKEQVRIAAADVPARVERPASIPGEEAATRPGKVEGSNLVQVVKDFPLKDVSDTVAKLASATGEGWRDLRAAVASSVRSGQGENTVVASGESRLVEAVRSFPLPALMQSAAAAVRSAREAFGSMRSAFARTIVPPEPAEALPASPPPETVKKLTSTDEELRKELAEVRQEKRELEKEIAERTGRIPGSVDAGQVRITTGRRFSGKVLVVNRKYNFIVVDVGKQKGLETGEVFIVHRGNTFIGKAQVIKVYDEMAAADLIMNWMQDDVQVNDGVKKF